MGWGYTPGRALVLPRLQTRGSFTATWGLRASFPQSLLRGLETIATLASGRATGNLGSDLAWGSSSPCLSLVWPETLDSNQLVQWSTGCLPASLPSLCPFCPHGVLAKPAFFALAKPYPNIPKLSGFKWCSSCSAHGLVPPYGVALA